MAGEPDKYVAFELDGERYMLTFNNAGRRAAEDELDKEWTEIAEKMGNVGPGARMQSALLFGATRKHHRREIPTLSAADAMIDRVDDAGDEVQVDFAAALMACFYETDKETWVRIIRGEDPEDIEEENDPKDEEKPKKSAKKKSEKDSGSPSEAGTDS